MNELKATLTSAELTDWIAYFNLEPFGEERADLRAGIVASTIYNVNRGKGRAMHPIDFMPKFDDSTRVKKTPEQVWNVLESFTKDYQKAKEKRG